MEKRVEAVVTDNHGVYRADSLHRGVPVPGDLASSLSDHFAITVECQDVLMTVLSDSQDLHPAIEENEYMRGRISLEAQDRARWVFLFPADS